MIRFKIFIPKLWEIFLFGLSVYLLIIAKPQVNDNFSFSVLSGTATCIMTAISILYIQRVTRSFKLLWYYSKIEDNYIRIDIGQDNSTGTQNDFIREKNLNLEINLTYEGENKFSAQIQYWKHENAAAEATFEFSETNKVIGTGIYKYISGQSFLNHFGSYQIFILENEPDNIYVRYQHVFPREMHNNPDNNRGWEIWKRKNSS